MSIKEDFSVIDLSNLISNPKNIYDFVDTKIEQVLIKLIKEDSIQNNQLLNIIRSLKEFKNDEFAKELNDFKRNQEWDNLNIAFYGETNAGKSTIIDTFRMYFKEATKIEEQKEFRKKYKEYKNKYNKLKDKLENIGKEIDENENQTFKINIECEKKTCKLKEDINKLISLKKENFEKSFLYKIFFYLKATKYQKEIKNLKHLNEQYLIKYKNTLSVLDETLNVLFEKKRQIEKNIKELDRSFYVYEDGTIIGDGRSDFTKKCKTYTCNISGQKISFVDVPGIEGKEQEVEKEIFSSIKKAHIVFYITCSALPPQKGDTNTKGTLEKIKDHLSFHTEVYTIYNKRVNNPIQLKNIMKDDEEKSLKTLDIKMKEALNENYKGHKLVVGKVSFLALSECLIENGKKYNEKNKYLQKYDKKNLLDKSKFVNIIDFLKEDIVKNIPAKIKKSNFNKVISLLEMFLITLEENIIDKLETMNKGMASEIDSSRINLNSLETKVLKKLDNIIETSIKNFEINCRKSIYKEIEEDISDDEFKKEFKSIINQKQEEMLMQIPSSIKNTVEDFQQSIEEILKNLKRRVSYIYEDLNREQFRLTLKFDIDNGIDKIAMGGALVGLIGLGVSNFYNPMGWVLLTLGTIGLVLSFAKSVWKFFSSKYKKSEQKKCVNQNLSKLCKDYEKKLLNHVKQLKKALKSEIEEIRNSLRNINSENIDTLKYVKNIENEVRSLINKINKEKNFE